MDKPEKIVIHLPGQPDIQFEGVRLAHVDREYVGEGSTDPFSSIDWSYLEVYRTADGTFVGSGVDYSDLAHVQRRAWICRDEAELAERVGWSELAKRLYRSAGINANAAPAAHDDGDEQKEAQVEPVPPAAANSPAVSLYDPEALKERIAAVQKQGNRRQIASLERLRESSCSRDLTTIEPVHLSQLQELRCRFPNLHDVLDAIQRHLSLCLVTPDHALRLPSLLLAGPAGTGKTRFLSEVARLLGAEFEIINCNVATAGFVISGNDSSWSEGKPGRVFEILCRSRTANPIILLDEIDKLSGDRNHDPHGPLYSLLEPTTSQRFADECLAFELDCSHIVWVASANDVHILPEPIQSRLTTIAVPVPRREDMPAIATSIYCDLLSEPWGKAFVPELGKDALARLVLLPPRLLRATLVDAMAASAANAVHGGSGKPIEHGLEVRPADIEGAIRQRSSRRIGFI